MLPPVLVSGLTVNIELAIAVMSINELLEVRLEFCMCIIGGRLFLGAERSGWSSLHNGTHRLPPQASRVPCHVVYRSIRSSEEMHELYI